jgi:hypothetical protein
MLKCKTQVTKIQDTVRSACGLERKVIQTYLVREQRVYTPPEARFGLSLA